MKRACKHTDIVGTSLIYVIHVQ